MPNAAQGLTYREAGVDIAAATDAVDRIKGFAASTLGQAGQPIGHFGGMYRLSAGPDRILVASADGVGTKLKLAFTLGGDAHERVGGDIVNHCVGDILALGARPLFFLDYIALGRLVPDTVEAIVRGMADACRASGLALIGGETAEMPGMYADGDYDLAGFCVGAVERGEQLTGGKVAAGDVILGLASSGVHSNGYSLVRRLAADRAWKLDRPASFDIERLLIDALLAPTRIYVRTLLPVVRSGRAHALAHITGGGLLENIPRVLPAGLHAHIDAGAWEQPALMGFLQAQGRIEPGEMARTFNCGIGMAVVTSAAHADAVAADLSAAGETVHRIGTIAPGARGCTVAGPADSWANREAWQATHHG